MKIEALSIAIILNSTFSYINAGRADLYTKTTINTVTFIYEGRRCIAFSRASGITTFLVVADNQRVWVDHGTLETCIRTHIDTNLLTHEATLMLSIEMTFESVMRQILF